MMTSSLALQAGMTSEDHPERLMIALEPEAASIYVRKLRLYQLVPDTSVTQTLNRNSGASSARANRYSYYAPDQTATGDDRWRCLGTITCTRRDVANQWQWSQNPKPTTDEITFNTYVKGNHQKMFVELHCSLANCFVGFDNFSRIICFI